MKTSHKYMFLGLLILSMGLASCSPSTPNAGQPALAPVVDETQPAVTEAVVETALPVEATQEITNNPIEVVTEEPMEAAMTTVTHQVMPGQPAYIQSLPDECNTGFNYARGGFTVHAPCDAWSTNLFERPVSQDLSMFYHYIDILRAQTGKDGDWYFVSMDLFGAGFPEDGSPFTYYFEIDFNQDGRGDVLIAVENLDLYASEWSVQGVRAWRDTNGDVGGKTIVRPDNQPGDGYDTLIFDQGLGDDPDLVWARHSPDNVQRIEFAFKTALLNNSNSFMWWAGAMRGDFTPQAFDLVDSLDSAELYQIDTTCGWVFGSEHGYNAKKCYIAPSPTAIPQQAVCIKPPHPNPQDNGWWWNEELCKWELIN